MEERQIRRRDLLCLASAAMSNARPVYDTSAEATAIWTKTTQKAALRSLRRYDTVARGAAALVRRRHEARAECGVET